MEQAEDALGLRHLRLEGAGTAQALDSVTQILLTAAFARSTHAISGTRCCLINRGTPRGARGGRAWFICLQERPAARRSPLCQRPDLIHKPSGGQNGGHGHRKRRAAACWATDARAGACLWVVWPCAVLDSRAATAPRSETAEARKHRTGPPWARRPSPCPPRPSQVHRLPQEGPGLLVRRPLRPQVPNGPRWNSPALFV